MTDEEILRYAAKAAGYVEPHSYRPKTNSLLWLGESGFPSSWKPFDDDAEAFKLMVQLDFLVQVRPTVTFVTDVEGNQLSFRPHKPHGGDAYAATRRAIVRAAAEIGKGMKSDQPV